jgi:prephenate dehydrogenase
MAVLGTGLIGGSLALAARAMGARVTGWDRPEVLDQARRVGAIDQGAADIASAVGEADVVIIALPIGAALDTMAAVAAHAPETALVTDTCSTKAVVCQAAARHFHRGARFLGGHPLAGRELGGIAHADATLCRGARYALIASELDDDVRVRNFAEFVRHLGAQPVWMDAQTHDWAAAVASHLPQLAAVALAGVLHDETDESGLPLALAGPGVGDALRLAGSPYDVWRDICHTNARNIRHSLDRLITALDHLRNHLSSRELQKEFAAANEIYKTLRGMK